MYEEYRMLYDLHTHTTYSHGRIRPHGKGSIRQNALTARGKGLQAIAISDHGPGHLFYGIRPGDIEKARQDIADFTAEFPDIRVYLSVEANLTNRTPNGLDVDPETAKKFDFLLAGYHYGVAGCYGVTNRLFSGGVVKHQMVAKVTDLYVKALYENKIKVLTHPGDKAPIDFLEVARACAANGTLMEINDRHKHLTVREIQAVMKEKVHFIIGSDAHTPEAVGEFVQGLRRAEAAGLPFSRIVNIERKRGE